MGVIKRPQFKHVAPEDESLGLQENGDLVQPEVEEVMEVPRALLLPAILPPRQGFRVNDVERRKSSQPGQAQERFPKGHRKRRRHENNRYLLSLAADDEPAGDLLGSEAKSAFSALFQEKDKMAAWNAFLAFNEDDQFAILANDEIFASINNEAVLENYSSPAIEKVRNLKEARRKLPASEAFSSLCPKLRSIFSKRHFPMGILTQLEDEIVRYFTNSPTGTCIIERSCSFDRLIVHAICHFHVLLSQSFTNENNKRETHIRNFCSKFEPPAVLLTQFLERKRS